LSCARQRSPSTAGGLSASSEVGALHDIRRASPKAKVLNRDRVRFEVAGGNYRLIASFDLRRQIVFVKFIGTHAEYDAIDALTVARF
jgi:mRNA interferase HigB